MSLDRSLKSGNNLAQHRNVLTRAERIERLRANEEFDLEKSNPIGLRKVANRKISTGKKEAKKAEAGAEGALAAPVEGAAPAAPAAGAKPGAGGKSASGAKPGAESKPADKKKK